MEIETLVTHRITYIDQGLSIRTKLIAENWLLEAEVMLANVDIDDAPFLALALQLGCGIWTGDKRPIRGLRNQGYNDIYNTEEIT